MINHEEKENLEKTVISKRLPSGEIHFCAPTWAERFSSAVGMVVSYFIQIHMSFAISW